MSLGEQNRGTVVYLRLSLFICTHQYREVSVIKILTIICFSVLITLIKTIFINPFQASLHIARFHFHIDRLPSNDLIHKGLRHMFHGLQREWRNIFATPSTLQTAHSHDNLLRKRTKEFLVALRHNANGLKVELRLPQSVQSR